MYRNIGVSDEERLVKKLEVMFSDFGLDLESVGYYISRVIPRVVFDRIMITLDAAEFYKDGGEVDEFEKNY